MNKQYIRNTSTLLGAVLILLIGSAPAQVQVLKPLLNRLPDRPTAGLGDVWAGPPSCAPHAGRQP